MTSPLGAFSCTLASGRRTQQPWKASARRSFWKVRAYTLAGWIDEKEWWDGRENRWRWVGGGERGKEGGGKGGEEFQVEVNSMTS
ncbi:unnamed protein product [Closterium sp. NIES-54]